MRKLLLIPFVLLYACGNTQSPETIKLEKQLDSIHSEVNKTKVELYILETK